MNFSHNTMTLNATTNGSIRRIRTPHPHDVLSGRGGSVNNHSGNVQFRKWVHVRKTDYNLAPSKVEKARVAQDIIALVRGQNPPGRFLQKDTSAGIGNWWIELDEDRVIAKTSQALREGAPNIRAAHQQEIKEIKAKVARQHTHRARKVPNKAKFSSVSTPLKRTREQATTKGPTKWPIVAPSQTSSSQDAAYQEKSLLELRSNVEQARLRNDLLENDPVIRAEKRLRMDENMMDVATVPSASPSNPPPMPLPSRQTFGTEQRQNSLALSEFSYDAALDDFVNPFTDETEENDALLTFEKPPRSISIGTISLPSTPRPGMLTSDRITSNGDFAGLHSLTKIPKQEPLNRRSQSGQSVATQVSKLDWDDSDPFLQYLRSLDGGISAQ